MRFLRLNKKYKLCITVVISCVLLNLIYLSGILDCKNPNVPALPSPVSAFQNEPEKNCSLYRQNANFSTLTIFTSFDFSRGKYVVNRNALKNWKTLKGVHNHVLFTNSLRAAKLGKSLNFTVLPITDTAIGGVPVLKTMFLKVLSLFPTSHVMYSNGDILYDVGLTETIDLVDRYVAKKKLTKKTSLIVGRRTNVDIEKVPGQTFEDILWKSFLIGSKFRFDALDYFIFDRRFPWKKIPEFVIGRVGYDNWLVAFSRFKNFTVVDASNTILAVHETISGINFEGQTHHDFSYNLDLIKKSPSPYNFGLWGRTDCCNLASQYDDCGHIFISQRTILPPECNKYYISHHIKTFLGLV